MGGGIVIDTVMGNVEKEQDKSGTKTSTKKRMARVARTGSCGIHLRHTHPEQNALSSVADSYSLPCGGDSNAKFGPTR